MAAAAARFAGKKALVTGASRGIGLELSRQLKEQGAEVYAACRQASEALTALGVQVIDGVDVAEEATVQRMVERLVDTRLDILINNAGILEVETLDDMNFETIRRQFDVNAMGPLRVTHALLSADKVASPGKIAVITSRMGSIGDNTSGRRYGYRMSKAAVNAGFRSLAMDLKDRSIHVGILHPGMVHTDMITSRGASGIPPAEAVEGLLNRIHELDAERSGRFFHQNGQELPW